MLKHAPQTLATLPRISESPSIESEKEETASGKQTSSPSSHGGKTAGLCSRYLSKGRKVAIDGRLQARSFDAQDGSKRYITEIIADQVEFLPSGQAKPESVSPEEKPAVVPMNDFYEYNNELPF